MAAVSRPPLSSVLSPAGTEWRPGCVIRPATTADAAAIAQVWSEAYHDDPGTTGLPPTFLAERTIDGFRPRALAKVPDTLVACDSTGAVGCGGGSIVGFCTAIAHTDEVEHFFLARSARGTGVATVLMAAVSRGGGEQVSERASERSRTEWTACTSSVVGSQPPHLCRGATARRCHGALLTCVVEHQHVPAGFRGCAGGDGAGGYTVDLEARVDMMASKLLNIAA